MKLTQRNLEALLHEHESIVNSIRLVLKQFSTGESDLKKVRKSLHWTQRKENKAKVKANLRKMNKAKRTK